VGLVKHTLGECDMLRCFYNKPSPSTEEGSKKGLGGEEDNKGDGFPNVYSCYMIFGGPIIDLSSRQRKLERREVFLVEVAALVYLDWFDRAITFNRDNHTDHNPNLGKYPLVVDPIIGNTRLTKVLMDGGNSLNIIYADTLELWGSGDPRFGPGLHRFAPSPLARGCIPSDRLIYLSASGLLATSRRRSSPSRWWGSDAPTTPCLGGHATPNLWSSRTTPT
jgi:hypothetical protein